jgi:hypothetical protein
VGANGQLKKAIAVPCAFVTTVIESQRQSLDCGHLSAQAHVWTWPTLCCGNKRKVVGYVRKS